MGKTKFHSITIFISAQKASMLPDTSSSTDCIFTILSAFLSISINHQTDPTVLLSVDQSHDSFKVGHISHRGAAWFPSLFSL